MVYKMILAYIVGASLIRKVIGEYAAICYSDYHVAAPKPIKNVC